MENKIREHKLTYGTLWRYYDETKTNLALCLSEFIDNSISSWKKGKKEQKLVIDIKYFDINKNTKMYAIVDNANGMNAEELDNAMIQYNDTFNKDNSSLNQYGIGMKFGIFWIGRDADIYTKVPGGQLLVGKYNAKNKKQSDVVKSTVEVAKTNPFGYIDHGTCIMIKEVYGGKRSITEAKLKELNAFLGYRYSKYISSGDVQINIEKYDKGYGPQDLDKSSSGTIQAFSLTSDKKSVLTFSKLVPEVDKRELIKDKYSVRISEIDDQIKKLSENLYYSPSKEYKLFRLQTLKETYERFFNDEPMFFEDKLTIVDSTKGDSLGNQDELLEESLSAKIKILFLSSPSKNRNGLSILHNGRYIYHPSPTKVTENISKNYEMAEERWNAGVHKWFAAELSLEDIETNEDSKYIKPDKNKSEIVFVDNLYQDGYNLDFELDDEEDISQRLLTKVNFDESLKTLLKDYLPFLVMIKDINEGNAIEKTSKKLLIAIKQTINSLVI